MTSKITRRNFLKASAATVLGAAVAACAQPTPQVVKETVVVEKQVEKIVKETVTVKEMVPVQQTVIVEKTVQVEKVVTATPKPLTYKEAPMLAELVKAGKLPPVAERLPKDPMVQPVVQEIGQYGGTWRRAFLGVSDAGGGMSRLIEETLLEYSPDASAFLPNLFSKWEVADGGKTFTFRLREGVKWSNGKPWTTDDLMFVYEDVYLNKELSPSLPVWLNFGGAPGTMEKVDNFTLRMKFAKGYGLLPMVLCNNSMGLQKEYFQQFHVKYADKAKLDALTKDAKFEKWNQLFNQKNNVYDNPDMPTMYVWVTKSRVADQRHVMERNPYYWKVDPQGNQLPYIDRITHDLVGNTDLVITKMIAGEIDFQGRHIDIAKVPLLQENAAKNNYRLIMWTSTQGVNAQVDFNLSYDADPVIAKYITNKRFRQAFSLAMDRDDYNRVIFLGRGVPRQATVIAESADFKPEFASRYVKYDPEAANKIFDELGLTKRDAEGYRIAPENGQTLTLINYVQAASLYEPGGPLITEYMKKVGIKVVMKSEERSIHYQRMTSNEIMLSMWGMGVALYPLWLNYAYWIVPWVQASSRIGPAFGLYRDSGGKSGKKPEGDVAKALDLFDQAVNELDEKKRVALASQVLDIASENVWLVGLVQFTDMPHLIKNNFRNVSEKAIEDTTLKTEKNTKPEQYFIKQ